MNEKIHTTELYTYACVIEPTEMGEYKKHTFFKEVSLFRWPDGYYDMKCRLYLKTLSVLNTHAGPSYLQILMYSIWLAVACVVADILLCLDLWIYSSLLHGVSTRLSTQQGFQNYKE